MLISEAFKFYERNYISIKFQSRRLRETHERTARTLVYAVGDKPIEHLTLDDIYEWIYSIGENKCQNTIRNYLGRVRAVLKYLNINNIQCLNYEMIPVPRRESNVVEYLTANQVRQMIDCASSLRNKLIISLLYSSGIRVSELVSLDRGQIRNCRFSVKGKGSKVRLCFIDARTECLMNEYLKSRADNSPALIVSVLFKERVSASDIQLIVKNTARRANIQQHVTPHTLRHSFASNFILNNGNSRHLQLLLGHSSLSTTMMYSHVADNELEEKYRQAHTI